MATMTATATTAALSQLAGQPPLSILQLSRPILHPEESKKRKTSTHEGDDAVPNTPASLAADLAHYQDLFSKLRFSYVEQVTKERFLRTLCAEDPDFVDAVENAELEKQLVKEKALLKEKKLEVREMILALEEQGRELARRYTEFDLQKAHLTSVPDEIAALEARRTELLDQQRQVASSDIFANSTDPDLRLPVAATRDRLREREQELQRMEVEIQQLQASVLPAKQAETQRLRDDLAPVELRRNAAVEEAQEAQRRRAQGGMADELEEKGRWLRGVEASLKGMLDVA